MKLFLGLLAIAGLSVAQEYNYNYQLGAGAPSYGGSSYGGSSYGASAPVYTAKPSYAPVHAGPAQSYSYPSPAPTVKCPTNLLLSCAPNVAPVPCQSVSYSSPSYSAPSYSAPSYSAPSYSAPSYSAPSYSAPSYSAPAASYSAPAAAPAYSAPASPSYK